MSKVDVNNKKEQEYLLNIMLNFPGLFEKEKETMVFLLEQFERDNYSSDKI
jgi:hypothetical protein